PMHRLPGPLSFDLEADDACRQHRVARGEHLYLRDAGESLLALAVEGGDALGDALAADALVKLEGFRHRPLVLVRLEAAGRNPRRVRGRLRWLLLLPRRERLRAIEGRDRGSQQTPVLRGRPDDAGAPGREDPLVGASCGEVTPELCERFLLVAETVRGVQHH